MRHGLSHGRETLRHRSDPANEQLKMSKSNAGPQADPSQTAGASILNIMRTLFNENRRALRGFFGG